LLDAFASKFLAFLPWSGGRIYGSVLEHKRTLTSPLSGREIKFSGINIMMTLLSSLCGSNPHPPLIPSSCITKNSSQIRMTLLVVIHNTIVTSTTKLTDQAILLVVFVLADAFSTCNHHWFSSVYSTIALSKLQLK
jgi:hypothetical protein